MNKLMVLLAAILLCCSTALAQPGYPRWPDMAPPHHGYHYYDFYGRPYIPRVPYKPQPYYPTPRYRLHPYYGWGLYYPHWRL